MKKDNKITLTILFLIPAFFIILIVALLVMTEKTPGDMVVTSSQMESDTNTVTNTSNENEKAFYTIKTTDKGLGVYFGNEPKPRFVLHEILLSSLPKFDRQLLQEGITVYSDEELYRLIEDLDS